MASMMNTHLPSTALSVNLPLILGLSPEFMDYIKQAVDGKQLVCKNFKESNGKLTLCLAHIVTRKKWSLKLRAILWNKRKIPNLFLLKWTNLPLARKRERAQSTFQELAGKEAGKTKKQEKHAVSNAETESPLDSQLSESSIQSPPSPKLSPSASSSPHKPVSADIHKKVEEVLLAPSAEYFFGPYQKDCYETCNCSPCSPSFDISTEACQYVRNIVSCDACLIPADQVTEGLKRCMRCKCVAYCSKSCQVAHWKQQHKPVCDKMRVAAEQATIAKARAHLVQRELRISHQSLIHRRAAYKSGIMERLTLISPFLGVICPTKAN